MPWLAFDRDRIGIRSTVDPLAEALHDARAPVRLRDGRAAEAQVSPREPAREGWLVSVRELEEVRDPSAKGAALLYPDIRFTLSRATQREDEDAGGGRGRGRVLGVERRGVRPRHVEDGVAGLEGPWLGTSEEARSALA